MKGIVFIALLRRSLSRARWSVNVMHSTRLNGNTRWESFRSAKALYTLNLLISLMDVLLPIVIYNSRRYVRKPRCSIVSSISIQLSLIRALNRVEDSEQRSTSGTKTRYAIESSHTSQHSQSSKEAL